MQDCVIDAARDGSAAENRAHWKKKYQWKPNSTSGLCYSYTWWVVHLREGGREIEPTRANSSNTQEGVLVVPEGEGRMLDSTFLMQRNSNSSLPSMPCEHITSYSVFEKKNQGLNRLLTLLKCHVRSLIKHQAVTRTYFFLWLSLGF